MPEKKPFTKIPASEFKLVYNTCACGCGKTCPQAAIKYYDPEHKRRHENELNTLAREQPKQRPSKGYSVADIRKPSEVRNHIREICKEYFDWDLQDFQHEMLDAMFEGGYLVINVPTDHSKSTMGTFLFPLLSLMENPNETHIICGANIMDSKRRVHALQLEIETNKALTQDFPHIAKPEEKEGRIWSATQFNVIGRTENKPNPSVLAAAIGSSDIKGRRGKLIMDDIEGEDARWSPLKREQMYSWLKLEAWRCYEDKRESLRPLLCLLGTPFDIDSIYFKVEQQGWKVIRYPVYKSTTGYDANGKPWNNKPVYLWPDKADKVERARRTLKKIEFSVAYLMDPTGGDSTRISVAQIQQATKEAEFTEHGSVGFVSLDPASGSTNARADYAGIAVLKINWNPEEELPEVEIKEAYNFTQGLFEQVHFCADLALAYGYPVIYETNGQQGGTYANSFSHLHPEVQLLRHATTQVNKFDTSMGLSVVKTLIVNKKLKIAEDIMESDGIQHLFQEIRDLRPPFNKHNHISAAIWFAVRYQYERVRYYKGPKINSGYLQPYKSPFGNTPLIYGNINRVSEYEKILQSERQKEYDRFARQLNNNAKLPVRMERH